MGVYMKRAIGFVLTLFLILGCNGCVKIAEKEEGSSPTAENSSGIQAAIDPGEVITGELAVGGEEMSSVFSVTPGENMDFTVPFDSGLMTVSIPDGALGGTSELRVSALEGSSEGCIAPGFLCEDNKKAGEHVELQSPSAFRAAQCRQKNARKYRN